MNPADSRLVDRISLLSRQERGDVSPLGGCKHVWHGRPFAKLSRGVQPAENPGKLATAPQAGQNRSRPLLHGVGLREVTVRAAQVFEERSAVDSICPARFVREESRRNRFAQETRPLPFHRHESLARRAGARQSEIAVTGLEADRLGSDHDAVDSERGACCEEPVLSGPQDGEPTAPFQPGFARCRNKAFPVRKKDLGRGAQEFDTRAGRPEPLVCRAAPRNCGPPKLRQSLPAKRASHSNLTPSRGGNGGPMERVPVLDRIR